MIYKLITVAIAFILIILIIMYAKLQRRYNKKVVKVFNGIYNIMSKGLFKNKILTIRTKIYNNNLYEEWVIKYKTILYLIVSWISCIVFIIFVLVYFRNNAYVTFTLIFFSLQIKNVILDILIGDDTNFLIGIYNYLTELQQGFSVSKDIMTALNEANENSTNYNIVKKMEEIISIIDDDIAIEEYLNECPNEFLKLLILNCRLTYEYGDKKDIENRSVFLENIFYIKQNIETEVFKRRQLEFWLRGLPLTCIVPLLGFTPFEQWVEKTLPITDIFYKTSLGFILKLILTATCIICFYIIKNFADSSKKKVVKVKFSYWEEYFLKINIIKKFILFIAPKKNSKREYKYRNLIDQSGEFTRIEYIYLRKMIFLTLAFLITLSLCISIHSIKRIDIIENKSSEFKSFMIIKDGEQSYSTDLEKSLLDKIDVSNLDKSYGEIRDTLKGNGITSDLDTLTKRIINKKLAINNEHLSILDFLISLIIAIIAYNIPDIFFRINIKLRKYQMENEIILFETIILILMYHENATSEVILETMSKFADIFKYQVDIALKEVRKSDQDALEIFVQELKYKPFIRIIKNIIKADTIKTRDAFISLADNRRNYLMNRKEENRRVVYKRVGRSGLISLVPLNAIIICYIAGPMLYVAFSQLSNTENLFNDMETKQIEFKK